jgi:uncharacterized Ntn-hydrolase superfamily protein
MAELELGTPPAEAMAAILASDSERETRQLGAVTPDGRAAGFTGSRCSPWAGHVVGEAFACQGNILAGQAVVDEMARAFTATSGELAERLVFAPEAGQAAGVGNSPPRCSWSRVMPRRRVATESTASATCA